MPQTLLLADDSITIQRVIELTFADEDIQVVAVGDGDQAIERLEAAPPDIVLADVGMPGRSGYEVAKYIKQSPRLAHIPVVLLTGAFEPVDQAKAAEARCDGVLAKPFEPQLVIGRVKDLLARGRSLSQSLDLGMVPPRAAEAESGTPPLADRPFEAPANQTAEPATVDTYFDRLDEALSSMSAAPRGATKSEQPSFAAAVDDLPLAYPPRPIDFDMFTGSGAPTPMTEATMIEAPPAPTAPIEWPTGAPPQVEAVQPPTPAPSAVAPITQPPIADVFAALLAAEQNQPTPMAAQPWPTSPPRDISVDTADLVEQVTRRVLERLSDRMVRETVTDIVSSIAERAVREEIERIKASIK